ncbi:MAG: 4-hydroxy-3-methylbut-2-enyl diphosphate reductase [Gemmatimonadaceae bacterium]|nr:4-hydroxy-3-methylbut-2-enyl diphosphate reductase [Gemmatimonadaceae bacterium]
MMASDSTYYRKGFGLKAEVQDTLTADYDGQLVDLLLAREHTLVAGDITVRLAKEFGFCYGVERAVEYAYQTRAKFPDKRIFLAGEIIHNPHVNAKLKEMGIHFLAPSDKGFDYTGVEPADVVILPAFGVTIHDFETLRENGCVMVDTTCGSVLNVWKRVEAYAKDGFTALIHGKYYHEETRATASQVEKYDGGTYLVVRNMCEAEDVMAYIAGTFEGGREAFVAKYAHAASPHFDPDLHLKRIGVANQTTMLARESLAIGEAVGATMERVFGAEHRATHFRTFDTICSATQDRQDAVNALLTEPLDVMLVVGGYNSSNTISLAALCSEKVRTYHIEDAVCLDPSTGGIRHRDLVSGQEVAESSWLPATGALRVGLTAGASTPNNKIGETVARVLLTRGVDPSTIV